jgi:hypothetical protein
MTENAGIGCIFATIVGIIIVCLAIAIVEPYYESKHYNEVTGAHTTYWDAVWLELRVQDQPKDQSKK